ncbi:hypothetical protein MD535_02035 [Vibrio sp. ZSDZ65]|uniref:Uncharacterized protein n=1 Tax=Vibrio qingdaonensis TaxID=2829491 RepID=A0A9X3CJY6_9VIBR|nr:hypothetical protein [Vibrio qingdaonensis]MCW8344804.1 hypothetical protein [Vibrio qingdaonensis]
MKLPNQSSPIARHVSRQNTQSKGLIPSGHNKQCCGDDCMSKYCFFGMSSKGCKDGKPYINCIG